VVISTDGDAPNASDFTFGSLLDLPRWVAWQLERVGGRETKVPYSPHGGKAKSDAPLTWGGVLQALDRFQHLPRPLDIGGVGIMLGEIDDSTSIGGVDLDTCVDGDGKIADWAIEVIQQFQTYGEISPSRTGVKLFFRYNTADLPALRQIMQTAWGKMFKRAGDQHPPAIEVHLGNRYFAMTGDSLDMTPADVRDVTLDELRWLLEEAGPNFVGATKKSGTPFSETSGRNTAGDFAGPTDQSRSAKAMALGAALKRAGLDFEGMCEALARHPTTSAWVAEKGEANGRRELKRIWARADALTVAQQAEPGKPSLTLLHRTMQPPPPLPLATFGPFWGDWIQKAAKGANAPADYTALALLAVVSALVGNSRWAKAWDGWQEPPVLWCCGVGDPSSGKTPGASPVIRDVLSDVEAWIGRDHAALHAEWATRNTAAIARRKAWEKAVEQAIGDGSEPPSLPSDAHVEDEPEQPRVRVTNITIEKMVSILARLPKGLLCANDELAQWFCNFQRYSSGSDRPFWLEAYMGGPFRLDRISRAEPVRIPRLSVALFGTAQPDKLALILKNADDGLISRFLFTWPDPIGFRRPTSHADIEAASEALCRLADLTMATDESGVPIPSYVSASDEAAELLEGFAKSLAEQETQAHGLMKGIIGKARGQTLRLALVLEFLWWCGSNHTEPTAIHRRVMEAAISLMATYFLPMAGRVLADVALPDDEKKARILAHWIVGTKPTMVNITAIRETAHLPGLRETEDVKRAVRFLCEANWLIEVPHPGRAGRPRGDYMVYSKLWDMLAAAEE